MRAHKEEAVAMVGEWSLQTGKKTHKRKHQARKKKKTLQVQPSEEKER
jgi:hypothetical protein